jgi:hypothetical protein
VNQPDLARLRSTCCSAPEFPGDHIELTRDAAANAIIYRQEFEELCGIFKRVCCKARVNMLHGFEIHAPTAEREIARSNQQVSIILAEKDAELGMEHACRAGDWLEFILTPDPTRALLA